MHKPRVLHGKFAAYLSPSQPFIHDLVTGLNQHVEGLVLCNRRENLERFPLRNSVQIRTAHLFAPRAVLVAAARIRKEHAPDLMHAHFGWSGIRMLLLKKFLDIPLVTTFGGRDAMTQIDAPHYRTLYDALLASSDRIVCVSAALADEMLRRGVDANRIRLIRRGTDLSRFNYVDRQGREPNQPTRLLMVGRLVEKKGHRLALSALAELVWRNHSVQLTIAGDGPLFGRLCRQRDQLGLERLVHFTGHLDQGAIRGLMARSDILLHSSITGGDGDTEGIPNAIVEGAATGLPVVASCHGGIAEVVADQETGLVVDEGDVDGLVEAIEMLVLSPARRLAMGKAASSRANVEFDLKDQIEQYRALYAELLGVHPDQEYRPRQAAISAQFQSAASAICRMIDDRSLLELSRQLIGNPFRIFQGGGVGSALSPWISRMSPLVPDRLRALIKRALAPSMVRLVNWKRRRILASFQGLEELDRRILSDLESSGAVAVSSEQWRQLEQLADWSGRERGASRWSRRGSSS